MQKQNKYAFRGGFTLIELVIATVCSAVVVFGIGTVMVDGQRGWETTYDRVYSDVVTDSYVARRKFDTVMRAASREKILLGDDASWVEVYYYHDATSTTVDRYARFYTSEGDLNLDYGTLDPRVTTAVQTVCTNVTNCIFKQSGRSVQMILTLDNGQLSKTVFSSDVLNNK